MQCAFLGTEGLLPTNDDALAVPVLQKRGCATVHVEWRDAGIDWNAFDLVVVRSTWNYPQEPERFLEVLEAIDASRATLCNSLDVMRANLNKTYLQKLESSGVPMVPTVWGNGLTAPDLKACFATLDCEELIVKPTIGAGASGIFRLQKSTPPDAVLAHYQAHAFMVQPLVASIPDQGESSLIYFDGQFSHAVQKIPGAGEFRVQEDFGGTVVPLAPEPGMFEIGTQALNALQETPTYVRVDLARAPKPSAAEFWLMELELIEPSLFLSTAPGATERFVEAALKASKQKK